MNKAKQKAFERYLEESKDFNLACPSIDNKSDKELKKELFKKTIEPYLDIALKEQEKELLGQIANNLKEIKEGNFKVWK